jgi:hypothetical protein
VACKSCSLNLRERKLEIVSSGAAGAQVDVYQLANDV